MAVKHNFFRLFALCIITILGIVGCLPAGNPDSYSAVPTGPTYTPAPPTATASPASNLWSATPDIDVTVDYAFASLLPPESNAMWTSTPGWLTPPSLTFTPSDTPTPTIIFNTPKPGQEQGIRGTVFWGGGPVNENGTAVSLGPAGGEGVFVLDAATKQVVAQTISSSSSGSFGRYQIKLLPGRYDLCIQTYDICEYRGIIITAGQYVDIDIEIPE